MTADTAKLLAIDDNPDNLIVLRAVLADRLPHVKFLAARSGHEGLELARAEDPDVILLDVVMPEMDGYAVCRQLKSDDWLRQIPVLFLTALRGDRASRVRALEAGAEGFLSKPVDEIELIAQVRAMAKVKAANRLQRLEKEQLAALVAERTCLLERELAERKRMEESLRQNEDRLQERDARFAKLSANVPGMLYQFQRRADGTYRIPFSSSGIQNVFGVPPEAVLQDASPIFSVILAEDRPGVIESIEESARNLTPWTCQYRTQLVGQPVRWMEGHSRPESLPDGSVLWHGYNTDITGRKQLEQAIGDEAERNRVLFERSPDGIVIIHPETLRFVRFNTAAHQQLGYSRDEFAQLTLLDVDARESSAETRSRVASVLEHGSADFETLQRTRDGGLRNVHVTAQIVTSQGQSIYYCVWRDITARKQAEVQIRQQAALLDASHDAILVWHATDGVQFMNPSAEELTEQPFARARSQPLSQVLRTRSHLELQAAIHEATARGEWSGELTLLTAEGRPRYVASRWTVLADDAPGPKSVLITCNDITEQKRLESQYLRAQRLESIGTLASGVAHDLNNILSPIVMGADMLETPAADEEMRSVLTVIRQSAERGRDIVKQLLTFARGGTSQKGPVQPRHLLKEIDRLLRETFPKNMQIYVSYAEEPATVLADPSQLHQVLMNLCVNARDAMPEGGVLFVHLENRTLDETTVRIHPRARLVPYVVFRVADNGMGIPAAVLDRIFDPFFTTKPAGKGTGLGLATVLGIAESHGGFVTVESQLGQGTTFEVFLPASTARTDADAAPRKAAASRGHGEMVLIVDDEPAIARLAETILRQHGYEALTAHSAAEALQHFERQTGRIRAALTDIMMPFGDGRDLIATLHALDSRLPIVAMSGVATAELQCETRDRGACGFLCKPFSAEKLLAALGDSLAPSSPCLSAPEFSLPAGPERN